MAQLYSRRFIVAHGLSGSSAAVVVPTGRVYIVKQLTAYMSSTLGTIDAFFHDLGSGAALFHAGVSAGGGGWFGFYGALVFEAGDSFGWDVSVTLGESADVFASGYDLSSP